MAAWKSNEEMRRFFSSFDGTSLKGVIWLSPFPTPAKWPIDGDRPRDFLAKFAPENRVNSKG